MLNVKKPSNQLILGLEIQIGAPQTIILRKSLVLLVFKYFSDVIAISVEMKAALF